MAYTKISVPDFQFAVRNGGFYYADLVRRIRSFNRINAPEITSEVDEEPFIQLERAFALVGHYTAGLLDVAAQENLLDLIRLPDSARELTKLIDYLWRDYSPATVDLLLTLASVPTGSVTLLESNSLFSTEQTEETEAISYEDEDGCVVGPCNVIDAAFGLEFVRGGADGETLLGEPTSLQSAAMLVTAADLGREVEVEDSVLGNNGVFEIGAVLTTGALSKVTLVGTKGGADPLFVPETGLAWRIKAHTANGATDVNTAGAPFWTPLATPEAGDSIYFGTLYSMWDSISMTLSTPAANVTGVWEYYDPDWEDREPDAVAQVGSTLMFNLNSLLGGVDRTGAWVKVTYLPTGVSELLKSDWTGAVNYVTTSGLLGQVGTASTTAADYAVGCDWTPLPDVVDGTSDLTADGDLEFTLPQTLTRNWRKVIVSGVEAYFVRYRVISVAGPTAPILDLVDVSASTHYVLRTAVQGETVLNEDLISGNGQADQWYELRRYPGLRDSVRVFVDEGGAEVEWTNVTALGDSLLKSGPRDRHFAVDQDSRGILMVRFGDGTRGRCLPLGVDNTRTTYRIDADQDGNVGAGTVVLNVTGASLISAVTNPRAAGGWSEADGASEESLALAKVNAPATLRSGNRVVCADDIETKALNFVNSSGSRPVIRAKAIEEGYGAKTFRLLVVGTNGVAISSDDKAELEEYFNGDGSEGDYGVRQGNTRIYVDNFVPRLITVSMTVQANAAVTQSAVLARVVALLNPAARYGSTWLWKFGGRVPTSRMTAEVFSLSPGNVFDVDVLSPTADVELLEDELPYPNSSAFTITIVPVS